MPYMNLGRLMSLCLTFFFQKRGNKYFPWHMLETRRMVDIVYLC